MEHEQSQIKSLFEKAINYFETWQSLFILRITEKTSDIISELISQMILLAFLFVFLLILNIGIAIFLGEILGKSYYGFFALAAFYAVTGWLLYLFRKKWMKDPIANRIIKKMTKK
jgi:hypothetical protein